MSMQQPDHISTRRIWNAAYPIILGSVASNVLIVTDTAFLGSLGEIALGGGVIGGLFYQVLLMMGWGISIGGQIIVARRVGQGAMRTVGRLVEHLLGLLVCMGVMLLMSMYLCSSPLLSLLVQSGEVLDAGQQFFNHRILGLPLAYVGYAFQAFYVGISRTKVITATTVLVVLTNIALDYGLIFGHFGLPAMGVAGAATASVVAELVGALVFIGYTVFGLNYKQFNLFRFSRFKPRLLLRILNVGWPLMFQFTVSVFVWFIFFVLIEKLGETQLAASNIVRSVYNIVLLPIWGFTSTTNAFVSQLIGRGDEHQLSLLLKRVLRLCLLMVGVLAVLCLAFGGSVLGIYTDDAALIAQTIPTLRVVALASLSQAMGFVLLNAVSGTGRTRVSLVIEMLTLSIYMAYTYLATIELRLSLPAVWCSEFVYGTLLAFGAWIYLRSGRWLGANV